MRRRAFLFRTSYRFPPIVAGYCRNLQVYQQARRVMFGRSTRLRSKFKHARNQAREVGYEVHIVREYLGAFLVLIVFMGTTAVIGAAFAPRRNTLDRSVDQNRYDSTGWALEFQVGEMFLSQSPE